MISDQESPNIFDNSLYSDFTLPGAPFEINQEQESINEINQEWKKTLTKR